MQILVLEYITGGGLLTECHSPLPSGSLLAEGTAMRNAIAADFSQCRDEDDRPFVVHILRDARNDASKQESLNEHAVHDAAGFWQTIDELCSQADAVLVIAPESNGVLGRLAIYIEEHGGKLISPNAEFIAWTGDKHACTRRLAENRIPVPNGGRVHEILTADSAHLVAGRFPCVAKPFDGAGSQGVFLIRTPEDLQNLVNLELLRADDRVESYHPGVPASIAVLCGAGGCVPCVPFLQHLTHDGTFRYLGGAAVTDQGMIERGRRLARLCGPLLADIVGLIGIDFVYGSAPDGSDDVVVEINPRITTSYIGLRRLATSNLAQFMCAEALQGPQPAIDFRREGCVFRANGMILDAIPLDRIRNC